MIMPIDITDIRKGLPGISSVAATQLYEAFEVCMHESGHQETVTLKMAGLTDEDITICWEDHVDEQIARTYADMAYTTEHGAVCLSVMLTTALTPHTIIERSRKGTGIDYWLGDKDSLLFQKKARLEISGILKGDDALMKSRHHAKTRQADKSDGHNIPAYISVIEFSRPKALFTKKQAK